MEPTAQKTPRLMPEALGRQLGPNRSDGLQKSVVAGMVADPKRGDFVVRHDADRVTRTE